jgi:hypothetical protein
LLAAALPTRASDAAHGRDPCSNSDERSTEMQTLFDSRSTRPGVSSRPRPWRNDGDYRVKLYKAASRAGHEDIERAVAALAERWAAEDAQTTSRTQPAGFGRRRR